MKKLLITIAVLLVIIGGAASIYSVMGDKAVPETSVSGEQGEAEAAGTSEAPDFKVYDYEGKPLTLADLEGKPAVLNFWASWCGPCKSEMAVFNDKYLELGDEIQFVMINLTDGNRETRESAAEFITSEGYDFPVYFDLEMSASNSYQAYSIPVTYFIDAQGHVAAQATGAIDADTLQQGIDMIIE